MLEVTVEMLEDDELILLLLLLFTCCCCTTVPVEVLGMEEEDASSLCLSCCDEAFTALVEGIIVILSTRKPVRLLVSLDKDCLLET